MISRILVPTDGSKVAQKAAKYAVDLAKTLGARIVLLSVIDSKLFAVSQTIPSIASPTRLTDSIESYMKQAAKVYMKDSENVCKRKKVKSTTVIRSGYPVEEIVKEAKRSKADLIVMGSHGKSALKAVVLGSTTFGVVNKDIKIPVLIVRR